MLYFDSDFVFLQFHFKDVKFMQHHAETLNLFNDGQVPCQFEFIQKPNESTYSKPWLTANPSKGFIAQGEDPEHWNLTWSLKRCIMAVATNLLMLYIHLLFSRCFYGHWPGGLCKPHNSTRSKLRQAGDWRYSGTSFGARQGLLHLRNRELLAKLLRYFDLFTVPHERTNSRHAERDPSWAGQQLLKYLLSFLVISFLKFRTNVSFSSEHQAEKSPNDDTATDEKPLDIPKELWMMVDHLFRNAVNQVRKDLDLQSLLLDLTSVYPSCRNLQRLKISGNKVHAFSIAPELHNIEGFCTFKIS